MNENIDFKVRKGTVIYANNQELVFAVCCILDRLGSRWATGDSYIDKFSWEECPEHLFFDVYNGKCRQLADVLEHFPDVVITAEYFMSLHGASFMYTENNKVIIYYSNTPKFTFNMDDKTVVMAYSRMSSDKLRIALDIMGATWSDDVRYVSKDVYDNYGSAMCYNVQTGNHGTLDEYLSKGYNVITVEDFFDLHNMYRRYDAFDWDYMANILGIMKTTDTFIPSRYAPMCMTKPKEKPKRLSFFKRILSFIKKKEIKI